MIVNPSTPEEYATLPIQTLVDLMLTGDEIAGEALKSIDPKLYAGIEEFKKTEK